MRTSVIAALATAVLAKDWTVNVGGPATSDGKPNLTFDPPSISGVVNGDSVTFMLYVAR
jgi:hypothetical protein